MLKTPSSRRPTRTTRCEPGGSSSARPIGYSTGSAATCADLPEREEALRVPGEELRLRLVREGQPGDVLRVVEVVVGPVGGEHRLVLAVEEPEEVDDVLHALGLLDRLRAVVE